MTVNPIFGRMAVRERDEAARRWARDRSLARAARRRPCPASLGAAPFARWVDVLRQRAGAALVRMGSRPAPAGRSAS